MKLAELKQQLTQHFNKTVRFVLPTGTKVPPHAHVTEIARIDKRFIDCGGTRRTETTCRLQVWFQDDTDHRLSAGKLLTILGKSDFFENDDVEVDVEYEAPFISQFPVTLVEAEESSLVIRLGTKHTACLAEDKCLPPRPLFRPLPTLKVS
ncbi:MAG: DUF6428 family protein [Limisphaerales bacterium]